MKTSKTQIGVLTSNDTSIADDDFVSDSYSEQERQLWISHNWKVAMHALIPVYGLAIILL